MSPASTGSRDGSRDRGDLRLVRHQQSFSESGRASVPMWDSSDPDRAPPPLPLNPGSSQSPITKPYVSANIEKAAALIASRALENTPSAYTTNPPPSPSPEKGIMKPHHRRMQTIANGTVGRISDSLERRSPDKSLRSSKFPDLDDLRSSRSVERSPTRTRHETPTPSERRGRVTVDENTPPAPAPLALQSPRGRRNSDAPLADVTNGASRAAPTISFDSLSSQILNITDIATNLQKEMSNLSRRSKDNASDLLGLREATTSRDEDIRKTLRDLVAGLDHKFGSIDSRLLGAPEISRSTPNLPLFIDEKDHATPTRKSLNLPRIGSPASFLDREFTSSPSVVSVDGAASIAMLEKVLREMATKDGQDKLMTSLEKVKAKAGTSQSVIPASQLAIDPNMMQKLEEILVFMKDMKADSGSKALVRANTIDNARSPSQVDMYLDGDQRGSATPKAAAVADAVADEIVKMLRSIKQSLSQNGGLTNEVKALVRELRGEVLGMGREIARKLDESETLTTGPRAIEEKPGQDEVARIVGQGLADLKEHIHHVMSEIQQQPRAIEPALNTQEVVLAVQNAMTDMPRSRDEQPRDMAVEREEMLSAVREAWEDCKPEIALEHFGLERDEILETLKEGLQSYQPQASEIDHGRIHEEVLAAVRQGLADFQPPPIQTEPSITKEELLTAVRECLENFDFSTISPVASQISGSELTRDEVVETIRHCLASEAPARQRELSRDDILDTVRSAMSSETPHVAKEVEFNREDLFDAIKSCLEGEQNPLGGMGERVVDAMHEFLSSMKTEFQQYSAANGRDTEQVLDAVKDGLEDLRGEIETYVDRAADVTGKDEIIDAVKAGFAAMQADMDKGFSTKAHDAPNTPELLDAMEKEFEHLRESIRRSLANTDPSADKSEILDAIRDMTDDRHSTVDGNSEDVIRMVKEELEHMRTALAASLIKNNSIVEREEILETIREGLDINRSLPKHDGNESILSNTSELLDAFQEGVDGIRTDIQKLTDKPSDTGASYEILDTLKAGIEDIRADIERVKSQRDDSEVESTRGREIMLHDENGITSQIDALKVMITQLRMKVEGLDIPMPEPTAIPSEMRMHKDDLDGLHEVLQHHANKADLADVHSAIRDIHDSVNSIPRELPEIPMPQVVMPANAACKEDTDAIETLLFNVKAKLDEMSALTPTNEPESKNEQLECIEQLLREVKTSVEATVEATTNSRAPEPNNKEDFTLIELLLKDLASSIEGLHDKGFNSGSSRDLDDGPDKLTKTDLEVLETLCMDIKDAVVDIRIPESHNSAPHDTLEEIRDSIKAFREQVEADNDLSAQAFEARKIEHGGLASKIDDVRHVFTEVRDELLSKLNGSTEGIMELHNVLGMHHESMDTYATAVSVAELTDLVVKNFESHMDHHVVSKSQTEERDATLFSKHEEMSAELKSKIEDRFTELMLKYDDAQNSHTEKMRALDGRDKEVSESVDKVKDVVGELKDLMVGLKTSVTETCEKMTDDSRTVFDIVDQSNLKLTDMLAANAQEHGFTRDEIFKAVEASTRVEGSLQEHQPAILAAVREVLEKVSQHYAHSQQQSESFSKATEEIMSGVDKATEEIKSGVNNIPSAIPPLLPALLPPVEPTPAPIADTPAQAEYDDSHVHAKLDDLILHSAMAKEAFATMDSHHTDVQERLTGLDKIDTLHQHLRSTAEEIFTMLTKQSQILTEQQTSRAEEAREAAIALEKRTAQKEKVESDIVSLNDEKNALIDSMAALRREHEELSGQTKRLSREVGKLETALSIRQEEMREMNARAETLERRILEGVLNHARSTKIVVRSVPKKKISPAERDASMSLKRVPSVVSTATAKKSVKAPSTVGETVGMALKKRTAPSGNKVRNAAHPARTSTVDRRILSSSHVSNSRRSDAPRAVVLAPTVDGGLVNLKRSHSVKSNPSSYLSGRKPSWSGEESYLADKENQSILSERELHPDDHSQVDGDEEHDDDDISDAGTERRTSFGGTSYMYTDSSLSRNTRDSRDSRRSTSYASSLNGTINGLGAESILEEEDDEMDTEDEGEDGTRAIVLAQASHEGGEDENSRAAEEEEGEGDDTIADLPTNSEMNGRSQRVSKYVAPSDSGIGTEPVTPGGSVDGWNGSHNASGVSA